MWLKRGVRWAAVGGPLALIVAIAVNGRYGTPSFDDVSFGPEAQARLLKYAPLVAASEALDSDDRQPEERQIVAVADAWIAEAESGSLRPVKPVEYDDPNQDSVLSQLKDAKASVLFHLEHLAKSEPSPDKAASYRLKALKIASVSKYIDFASVQEFGTWQARLLAELRRQKPSLSARTVSEVQTVVRPLHVDKDALMDILVNLRNLHRRYMDRTETENLPIEIGSGYGLMVAAVDTGPGAGSEQLRESISERKIPSKILGTANITRVAMTAEQKFENERAAAVREFQSVK
ncbi:MAG: hypothetical protein JST30_06395 [Armatimonadetes bacterium]|nr:hypothetical protein [Armatimonadota bacterium]